MDAEVVAVLLLMVLLDPNFHYDTVRVDHSLDVEVVLRQGRMNNNLKAVDGYFHT